MHSQSFERSTKWQGLLAETLLALLSRDIALLDVADLSRRRAFVQVLDELAQRILIALCFASDLVVLSVAVMCRERWRWSSIHFHHFHSAHVQSTSSPQPSLL